MTLERTLFFIKPYIEPELAAQILLERNAKLASRTPVILLRTFSTSTLSLEFWEDFYSQVGIKHSVPFRRMCDDFASCPYGIIGNVVKGEGVIELSREIMGASRVVENNPRESIRGRYGDYRNEGKEWRTVAHSLTPDELDKDLAIFAKYRIASL